MSVSLAWPKTSPGNCPFPSHIRHYTDLQNSHKPILAGSLSTFFHCASSPFIATVFTHNKKAQPNWNEKIFSHLPSGSCLASLLMMKSNGTLARFIVCLPLCERTTAGRLPLQLRDSSGFSPDSPLLDSVILFFNYQLIEFYHRIFTYSILFCNFLWIYLTPIQCYWFLKKCKKSIPGKQSRRILFYRSVIISYLLLQHLSDRYRHK